MTALPPRAVVLVEGESDAAAVRAAAELLGRDLAAERVEVAALGGATGVRRYLAGAGAAASAAPGSSLSPAASASSLSLSGVRVAGLCDERESSDFAAALGGLETHAVFVCRADLEDELIRALGVPAVELLLEHEGELQAFRTLQSQPAHRGRPAQGQLRRFLGAGSGRKIRYGRLLVEGLAPEALPEPLAALLRWVAPQPS
jgi:hypothetical protein